MNKVTLDNEAPLEVTLADGTKIVVSPARRTADDEWDPFGSPPPSPGSGLFLKQSPCVQKQLLLEHYAEREPKEFKQFDVFTHNEGDTVGVDQDGDTVFFGWTCELMIGAWDLRCLINPELRATDVVRALRKIADGIEQYGWGEGTGEAPEGWTPEPGREPMPRTTWRDVLTQRQEETD